MPLSFSILANNFQIQIFSCFLPLFIVVCFLSLCVLAALCVFRMLVAVYEAAIPLLYTSTSVWTLHTPNAGCFCNSMPKVVTSARRSWDVGFKKLKTVLLLSWSKFKPVLFFDTTSKQSILFFVYNFLSFKLKQAMITWRRMAENRFYNVYNYPCLIKVLYLFMWILIFHFIPFPSYLLSSFIISMEKLNNNKVSQAHLYRCKFVFGKKKNRKLANVRPSLHFYWYDNFGENQTPLQRNGLTAIPKIV